MYLFFCLYFTKQDIKLLSRLPAIDPNGWNVAQNIKSYQLSPATDSLRNAAVRIAYCSFTYIILKKTSKNELQAVTGKNLSITVFK